MAVSFKDDYIEMDKKYGDELYKMFGPTLLSFPLDVDASRLYMYTSEFRQSLTLLNPDVARVQTGYERPIGLLNRSYKKLEGTWEVVDIIPKFENAQIYTIVFYNADIDTYDVLEKQIAESLTERFGYIYNTNKMDSLKIGDCITDEIIYRSTAYDDNMNYRSGKNAKVYYSTSNDTLEDAVKIRKGWADTVKTVEIDTVQVPVNDNHALLNIYGKNDDEYKTFPDIGECVENSIICATRVINKEHLFIDFQTKNMKEIYNTDTEYFVSDESFVYDINVFYNGNDEFPDNLFYRQLKGYYDANCIYADRIYQWCKQIKESGSKYTENVSFFKSKYQHFNDPEYKWKNKDKAFGNIVIEFKVKSIVGLDSGSKIAGRYGDKGVVSKVVDDTSIKDKVTDTMDSILDMLGRDINDEERDKLANQIEFVDDNKMPYTDDFPVDIILNSSGAIRRLNSGQIYEVDLNFASEQIRKKICTLDTIEEKEEMIFEFLELVNKDQCEFFYSMYNNYDSFYNIDGKVIKMLDTKSKEAFIRDVEENGFYLIKPPDSNIRYETMKEIYKKFDFIKPLPMYIDLFGIKKKRILKDGVVGDKYMIILKHNNNKNFSARSTFRVNRANLPAKDTTKRNNRSSYSHNPIRIGESYNLMAAISGTLLAKHNIFMRSSTLGKKSLSVILEKEDNPLSIKKLKIKDNYINANADILNARLKGIALRVKFVKDGEEEPDMIEDTIVPLYFGKYTIYDTPLNKPLYNKLFGKFLEIMSNVSVMESYSGEKENIVWNEVFKLQEIKDLNIPNEIKDMICKSTLDQPTNVIDEND